MCFWLVGVSMYMVFHGEFDGVVICVVFLYRKVMFLCGDWFGGGATPSAAAVLLVV